MPNEKPITLEAEEESLFNEVLRIYGNYSAIGLMNFTHNETPWGKARRQVKDSIS